jgi:hypothetical protein
MGKSHKKSNKKRSSHVREKKQKSARHSLKGGEAPFAPLGKYCYENVDVSQYMAPCKHLDNIQSGHELQRGGSRRCHHCLKCGMRQKCKNCLKSVVRLQKGGCGDNVTHCLGQSYPSMGEMTGQTGAVSASELAWCYRNVYGAVPSTNKLVGGRRSKSSKKSNKRKQRGGGYYLQLDQAKVGGLAHVASRPEQLGPSTTNFKVISPFPSVNERYNQRGGSADVLQGNFSPDMQTRAFECNQPNWCASCI